MGIDASIPLQVKPFQQPDQLNMMAQVLGIKSAQNQNELASYGLSKAKRQDEETNALTEALRRGLDLSTPEGQTKAMTIAPNAAGAMIKGRVDLDNTRAQIDERTANAGKSRVETVAKTIATHRDQLGNVTTPQAAAQWTQAQYADPVLGPILSKAMPLEAAIQSIPQDQQGFQRWVQQQALGMSEFLKQNKPTIQTRNTGGSTDTIAVPGLGGPATVINSVKNTQSPDNAASNARIAADAKASRDQSQRHHDEALASSLSKPFEVTGEDGQAVLVQQDKQGKITPVSGYAPKGGGKPLPNAALKQITEVRDNANTIDRLATSFKPEFAEKGVYGFGADASLNAKGVLGSDKDSVEWWKNYRKQAELVERHSMFGAALTPGEQASWRSADIGPGMDSDVIKRNLKTRQELTAKMLDTTRQDLIDAGHSEQRVNAIAGRGPKANTETTPAAPHKVTNDAEYNALPSGSVFVGPDGKQRRKP